MKCHSRDGEERKVRMDVYVYPGYPPRTGSTTRNGISTSGNTCSLGSWKCLCRGPPRKERNTSRLTRKRFNAMCGEDYIRPKLQVEIP
jgi:hypothetical protein